MNTLEQLDILMRAAYPIIYIVSHEEDRVKAQLKRLARDRNKILTTWSCTQGLISFDGSDIRSLGDDTRDPFAALEKVEELCVPSTKGTIWVFCDLHPYLDDPMLTRKLKEIAQKMKTVQKKTLVLLSPILKLPTELDKSVTVLDWPLPTQADIERMLTTAMSDMKAREIEIVLSEEEKEKIIKSCSGLTSEEIENVLSRSLIVNRTISTDFIIEEKKQIVRKEGILEYFDVVSGLNDVGGLEQLKIWLRKRGSSFTDAAKAFGLSFPKGVLLLGVQGCGKSLVCKAVANLWQLPLIKLEMGKIFEGVVGGSEAKISKALAFTERIAPCILWVDEIDKGFAGMGSSNFSDAGTTARVIGSFLAWMQEKKSPVFIVATANDIQNLPPELLRKGRFDEIFFIDLPDEEERKQILDIHIRKRNRDSVNFDLDTLAGSCKDFSGAEIEAAIEEGMFSAFDAKTEVQTKHIADALSETVPLSKTMAEKIDALRTWASTRARYASKKVPTDFSDRSRAIEM